MEYFADGTVTVVGKGVPRDGVYKFIEKDRIELNVGSLGAKRRVIVLARISHQFFRPAGGCEGRSKSAAPPERSC